MAFQQSDLETLEAAIASGVLKVRFADGRETQYQTIEGLTAAYQLICSQLATSAIAAQGGSRRRYATFRNGL